MDGDGGFDWALLWPILWGSSLVLPVAIFSPTNNFDGLFVLALGWLGVLGGQFGWLANIGFVASFFRLTVFRGRGVLNLVIAVVMVLPALNALTWHKVYWPDANGPVHIQSFGLGFYLWLAAIFGSAVTLVLRSSTWRQFG
jgi:hypothetical protein